MLLFVAPESGGLPVKSEQRPQWALLSKVMQNMESILFKDKFFDWPENSALSPKSIKEIPEKVSNKTSD